MQESFIFSLLASNIPLSAKLSVSQGYAPALPILKAVIRSLKQQNLVNSDDG
ncbi:hypothetical protein Cylst_3005 [Cylindrospermum stagnale PCC 7417]|uniref:Uncharacterized protein n=1 Tax=Cylindrospermum stagnale PCC 7417 TaxID=56107 RepID=K9WZF2_9NOST|nr:hypothetical protein Cylst_3005 [Cylindrospermum stagnale PCC 7417]